MNRRSFLKASGVCVNALGLLTLGCAPETEDAAAAQASGAAAQAGTQQLERVGVQLYTVRSLMENDFAGTIEQVAQAGFDEVEFAGYFDHSPEEVKALLDRVGLTAPAVHVGLDLLQNNLENVLDAAEVIGHQYVILPWIAPPQRTADGYRQLAEDCNRFGEACQERGLQFAYHNHDFEFETVDGTVAYDLLLESTDPDLVVQEIDLFWIIKAGYDPLAYFERYPGRFHLCHVKDMADRSGAQNMVAVGEGEIDFASIFAAADQAGLRHFIVEHDNPEDPLASIRTSHQYLEGLQF